MSGYYYECPTCSKVHPLDAKPLIWFDVDRIDPETAQQLLTGQPMHACPTLGGDKAIGSITRLPLPDRKCDHCGAEGCSDCISLAGLCPTCFTDLVEGQAHVEGACKEDCKHCS